MFGKVINRVRKISGFGHKYRVRVLGCRLHTSTQFLREYPTPHLACVTSHSQLRFEYILSLSQIILVGRTCRGRLITFRVLNCAINRGIKIR